MEIRAKEEEKKERIDKYLTNYLDYSRTIIDGMISNDYILVNNNPVSNHYEIKTNDLITVKEGYIKEVNIEPENIPINIIYEDDYLMVINKPSGMVVHPAPGNKSGTLVNALMNYTNNLSDINGEIRPGIVHRIDKDTSGLMLVAKTNKAHELLSNMLASHEIKRDYIALVHGEFPSDTATIDAPIGRSQIDRKKMEVTSKNSKKAITHVRVLKRYKDYTLLRLSLETGRTHQIRVHMNYIGYPVVNDPVYSRDSATSFGQFLHSAYLDFIHPITHEKMHFEAKLPVYFKDYLNKLEEK